MADNTIFNEENSTSNDNGATDQNGDSGTQDGQTLESQLIGEGKKYATLEEALKSVEFAQNHIAKLEGENDQLRSRAYQGDAVNDILAKIEANKQAGNDPNKGIDLKQIDSLLETKLNQRTQKELMDNNIRSVDKKMREKFGDKAKEALSKKATELGLTIEVMQETAAKSPGAFMAWFGTTDQNAQNAQNNASLNSDVNTANLDQQQSVKQGTYAWYKQQFKSQPHLRNDKDFQNRMMADAIKLGDEAFYS